MLVAAASHSQNNSCSRHRYSLITGASALTSTYVGRGELEGGEGGVLCNGKEGEVRVCERDVIFFSSRPTSLAQLCRIRDKFRSNAKFSHFRLR